MPTIYPSNLRPVIPPAQSVQWSRPVLTSTARSFGTAAGSLLAVRGMAQVVKHLDRQTPSADLVHLSDPDGTNESVDLYIQRVHPLATRVGIVIHFQSNEFGSVSPEIRVRMVRLSDSTKIDPPAGDPAVDGIKLLSSQGDIPPGGRAVYNAAEGTHHYPPRSIACVFDSPGALAYPTGPRALKYDPTVDLSGDGVKITVSTTSARIISVSAFEIPRDVVEQ